MALQVACWPRCPATPSSSSSSTLFALSKRSILGAAAVGGNTNSFYNSPAGAPPALFSSRDAGIRRWFSTVAASKDAASSASTPSRPTSGVKITPRVLDRLYSRCPRAASRNPFNIRLTEDSRPFFPITCKNLRQTTKNKPPRHKRGKGNNSRGHTMERHPNLGTERGYGRSGERMWEGDHITPLWKKVARWPEAIRQRTRAKWDECNLARIRYFIETGRLDPRFPITQRHLLDSKCVRPIKTGVRVFNVNDYPFPYKIDLEVAAADQSTIDLIRAVGGTVTIVYLDRIGLRAHLKPHKFDILPKTARSKTRTHYLEKMRARGCLVRYIKPLWLIREEQRIKMDLREQLAANHLLESQADRDSDSGGASVGASASG
ncbi:unnamed protein product [Amoebophrya sp. A25]|nr:unnamed protein product [Amoebophrya sp. A25]|eukprot:GSA25T00003086001.1